jgi:hypothetical protein
MRCGSMASSSQPGGAEQPVLVPLLRWSSPAQVALPAVLRLARRFVPSAGRRDRERTRSAGQQVECGRIPCGATERHGPHAKMILSLAVSCRGGRAGRVDVAAGPRSGSWRGRGNRARRSPASAGSRTTRTVPARPAPAGEPFTLVEPPQVETRGYRSQSLSFSSACLINGRGVTCSCWSRSAVLS